MRRMSRGRRRSPLPPFFALGILLLISAQDLHPQETGVTLRSETELVLNPAIVRNKAGARITDLSKDDFVVREDGKVQRIAVFEKVATTAEIATYPNLPPGEFTNVLGSRGPMRLTIIVLDTLNTRFTDQVKARASILNFLSHRIDGHEPIALMTIGPTGIRVLHDFSSDAAVLKAALEKYRPGASPADVQTFRDETARAAWLSVATSPSYGRVGSLSRTLQRLSEFETGASDAYGELAFGSRAPLARAQEA